MHETIPQFYRWESIYGQMLKRDGTMDFLRAFIVLVFFTWSGISMNSNNVYESLRLCANFTCKSHHRPNFCSSLIHIM